MHVQRHYSHLEHGVRGDCTELQRPGLKCCQNTAEQLTGLNQALGTVTYESRCECLPPCTSCEVVRSHASIMSAPSRMLRWKAVTGSATASRNVSWTPGPEPSAALVAGKRGHCARLCRRSRPGSRDHHRRHGQRAVGPDVATRRCGRGGHCGRLTRRCREVARRDPRLDVPARAQPRAGTEQSVAGLLDVPVRACATVHRHAGTRRGPLVTISAVGVLFGLYGPGAHAISAIPVFAWEVSLAVYLIVKGFKPSPITAPDYLDR